MEPPATRYALTSDDVHIAYQTIGTGPLDLVFVNSLAWNVEIVWEEPRLADFLKSLSSFTRLILFDKRGTGMSDPVPAGDPLTLERRMEDMKAVMEATESEQAAVLGFSDGGTMAALFAATFPERVSALVLWGTTPRVSWAEDWPWGLRREEGMAQLKSIVEGQHDEYLRPDWFAPTVAHDQSFRRWWGRMARLAASPSMYVALLKTNGATDIRPVLSSIRTPTLVMCRKEDGVFDPACSRYIASEIEGARLVEFSGRDHWPWIGDARPILAEIQEFLTGARPQPTPDRVLGTVVFGDIVGSTARLGEVGDQAWAEILDAHDRMLKQQLLIYDGKWVKSTGDGALVMFDYPGKAIRAANRWVLSAQELGLEVRAGVHTGEVERRGNDVTGIAVHIASRVSALAQPGEVLTTRTVRDLVAGSSIQFEERGDFELRGVPGEWEVELVVSAGDG